MSLGQRLLASEIPRQPHCARTARSEGDRLPRCLHDRGRDQACGRVYHLHALYFLQILNREVTHIIKVPPSRLGEACAHTRFQIRVRRWAMVSGWDSHQPAVRYVAIGGGIPCTSGAQNRSPWLRTYHATPKASSPRPTRAIVPASGLPPNMPVTTTTGRRIARTTIAATAIQIKSFLMASMTTRFISLFIARPRMGISLTRD
jgi:hypothetical protein